MKITKETSAIIKTDLTYDKRIERRKIYMNTII